MIALVAHFLNGLVRPFNYAAGTVLYVLCLLLLHRRRAKYGNAFYTLIRSLAVSDLCFLAASATSSTVHTVTASGSAAKHIGLWIVSFFSNSFYLSNIWHQLFIAVNRTIALIWPTKQKQMFTVKTSMACCAASYALGFAMRIPLWFECCKYKFFHEGKPYEYHYINSSDPSGLAWIYISDLGYQTVLISTTIILYMVTLVAYYKHRTTVAPISVQRDTKTEMRLLVIAILVSVPQLGSQFLYQFNWIAGATLSPTVRSLLTALTNLCISLVPTINPFVYLYFNTDMREEFITMFLLGKGAHISKMKSTAASRTVHNRTQGGRTGAGAPGTG